MKRIFLVAIVLSAFFFLANAQPALAQENIPENVVTENELQEFRESIMENLKEIRTAQGEMENRLSENLREIMEAQGELRESISGSVENIRSDMVQMTGLMGDVLENLREQEKEGGEMLRVLAMTEENFITLNFGGMGGMMGFSSPFTRGGGGFSISVIPSNSIVAVIDLQNRLVSDAEMSVMIMGENGPIMNPDYPMQNGYTQLPPGRVSGSVTAPGFQSVTFFAVVKAGGEKPAPEAGPPEEGIDITSSDPLVRGKSNIIYARSGGEIMNVDMVVEDPDAEDPSYRHFEGTGGSVSVMPSSDMFRVKVMDPETGEVLMGRTLYPSGGGGISVPFNVNYVIIIVIVAMVAFIVWRRGYLSRFRSTVYPT